MTDPASIYEEWSVPAVFAPLARQVLEQIIIVPGARALDVACGSGIVARTIARRIGPAGRVVGLDLNPAMLEVARRKSEMEGLTIEWRQGSAQALPFENGSFDLVLCQHGLQLFSDRLGAVSEMYRVLSPGGQAAVVTWRGLDQNPFFALIERAVRHRCDAPAMGSLFSLGDPAAIGSLLLEAGFANVSIAPVEIETDYGQPDHFVELQINASAAVIPSLQALPDSERAALIAAIRDDLAEPVRDATADGHLRVPMKGIVARGWHP
jgi:SAM-dependent methyltransferase